MNSVNQVEISIINIDALEFTLDNLTDKYDLIFIDAAKSQYIKFFEKFEKYLNINGVIVSDNLSFHGLVDYLDFSSLNSFLNFLC